MKNYIVRAQIGSTDEVRVKKYLEKAGIEYSTNKGAFETNYIRFKTDKATWKQIKKDLDLAVDTVYCSFRELVK